MSCFVVSLLFYLCNWILLFVLFSFFLIYVLKGAEEAVSGVGGGQVPRVASGVGAQAGTWQSYPTNNGYFEGLQGTCNGHIQSKQYQTYEDWTGS